MQHFILECEPGKYLDGSSCTVCAAGNFKSAYGDEACTPCVVGQYQASTGQTSCDACPTSKTTDATGKTALIDCSKWNIPLYTVNCFIQV